MENKKNEVRRGNSAFLVIKILFAMYIVTGILLLILAVMLYKFELGENIVNIGVIVTYIVAGFLGGFVLGKVKQNRKFLWGMMIGGAYFLILILASVVFQKGFSNDISHFATTFVLCVASGMAGGMLS